MKQSRVDADFALIVAACDQGERAPQNQPLGPLHAHSVRELYMAGRIRSEVYMHNFRRIVIVAGPHKGKATKRPDHDHPPYRINGVLVRRLSDEARSRLSYGEVF